MRPRRLTESGALLSWRRPQPANRSAPAAGTGLRSRDAFLGGKLSEAELKAGLITAVNSLLDTWEDKLTAAGVDKNEAASKLAAAAKLEPKKGPS